MGFWSKVGGAGKRVVSAPVDHAKSLLGVEQARENLNWMGRLAKGLLPSSVKVGMVETFDHAMERQGVTQEDLEKIYTNHVLKFWICAIMLLTGLAVGLNYLLRGQVLVILPVAGFSAVCLSQMFAGSFRAYQVGSRRFCDVSEWLGRREAWVPFTFQLPPVKKAPLRARSAGAVVPVPKVADAKGNVKRKD